MFADGEITAELADGHVAIGREIVHVAHDLRIVLIILHEQRLLIKRLSHRDLPGLLANHVQERAQLLRQCVIIGISLTVAKVEPPLRLLVFRLKIVPVVDAVRAGWQAVGIVGGAVVPTLVLSEVYIFIRVIFVHAISFFLAKILKTTETRNKIVFYFLFPRA